MLTATVNAVCEVGYAELTVAAIVARARVSRKTFYELFQNCEDCFLAAFDDALGRICNRVLPAYRQQRGWREGNRAGLAALLIFLDEHPLLAQLCFVHASSAGPAVLERRAVILEACADALERGRRAGSHGRGCSALTAEGLVGAIFAVIHARLLKPAQPLTELQGALMSMIVLPYLGPAAARSELALPRPRTSLVAAPQAEDPLSGVNMRLTYRTTRVLLAVGAQAGMSNREIAYAADVSDQGQISKLLARLESLGLIHNTARELHHTGTANAWALTARGWEIERGINLTRPGVLPDASGAAPPARAGRQASRQRS